MTWAHLTISVWVQRVMFTDECYKTCRVRILQPELAGGHIAMGRPVVRIRKSRD